MNNQSNYRIPTTKKEKIILLKAMMRGEMSIKDLKNDFKITMWMEDESDPAYLKTFDGANRITRQAFEESKKNSDAVFVTLDLG